MLKKNHFGTYALLNLKQLIPNTHETQEAQLLQRQRAMETMLMTNRETAIQGHSRSSVVVPIDTTYMTCY